MPTYVLQVHRATILIFLYVMVQSDGYRIDFSIFVKSTFMGLKFVHGSPNLTVTPIPNYEHIKISKSTKL